MTEPSSEERCERAIDRALGEPALPGAPAFEAARADILLRAKGEPVLLLRAPRIDVEDPALGREAEALAQGKHAYAQLRRLLARHAGDPRALRGLVLREGYLYAESPSLALALTEQVSADQLFEGPRLWVQRGARLLHAERGGKGNLYQWSDGPEPGRPVRLLHLDRVGSAEQEPGPALQLDLRELSYRLGFDRMRVLHLGERQLVAELRYGDRWVKSLLGIAAPRLELECELVDPEGARELASYRADAERTGRALSVLRAAILDQVDEALPFDEPKTEVEQQDGQLRSEWRTAYLQGRTRFRFGPDEYPVFDPRGRPRTPQVCMDFVLDTLERMSGTAFTPRGEPPGRRLGKLDLTRFDRERLRSALNFIDFASALPEWFEVLSIPAAEQVPFTHEQGFRDFLLRRADDFRPGDVVIIHGEVPWDAEHPHYHSFYVYERDPLSGLPVTIAGNAGRPRLRVWITEMWRTPKRSILARVRPRSAWLEAIAGDRVGSAGPPPLVGGP